LPLLAVTFALHPSHALACGVSGPDGLSACSLEEHEESLRPRWRTGASGVHTSTALRFDGEIRGDEMRNAALATVDYMPNKDLTLQMELGVAAGGTLAMPAGTYSFSPGPTAAVGASWRMLPGPPFLILTSLLSFSAANTHLSGTSTNGAAYDAFDLRLGALFGVTLAKVLSPYALGRVFGGPVYWRYQGTSVTGTDVHHFQLGGGLALRIGKRLDVFAEAVPLGEQAVSAGLAATY
jgi:hypothetical protein